MSGVGAYDWFEVWAEDLSAPPHLTILLGNTALDRFEAFDPIERRTWFVTKTYEDACNELWEDEFTLVTGRTPVSP